jgi:hypothetical protein
MKPEKQNLIRDLLGEDTNREATLLAGTRLMRRRRYWRAASRGGIVLTLIAVVAVLSLRKESPLPRQVVTVPPKAQPVSQVQALTDDELLALFPTNTPIALASLPDGKKRLIFPRPGDEQRYIKRL